MKFEPIFRLVRTRVFVLCVGVLIGMLVMNMRPQSNSTTVPWSNEYRAMTGRGHVLTNPLLSCADLPEAISIGDRKDLEKEVRSFIDKQKSDGVIVDAAVYYRDLNNGPWFGINEEATFDPASLFKVPLAMTYFWQANEGSDILNEQIEYKSPTGTSYEFFPSDRTLATGKIYTIFELIEYMLRDSDNDAAVILSQYAGLEQRNNLYEDLGLRPLEAGKQYIVDVHTYASFFRILFNATYIGLRNSESMLKILRESPFTHGLVAGVPTGTVVAHKFGEHVTDGSDGKLYQLHDCGIVYAPNKPYVLCVMTRGTDMQKLPGFISAVSQKVYDAVH